MAVNPHRRLDGETVALTLEIGKARHHLDLSLMYDERGTLRELVFVGRGKIGQGLDLLLHDLGIKLSRAIQGRDPDTGLDDAAELERARRERDSSLHPSASLPVARAREVPHE